jgi:hypothetical protein
MQALVHAQEGVLTQFAGVVRMADHALDDVPAQALVVAHEPFERARHIAQHGSHQRTLVGGPLVSNDRAWRTRLAHAPADTPVTPSVASAPIAPRATGITPAVSIAARPHPPEHTMNFEILIPITLFICIVYAIKVVVDARVRKQMMESNGSEELVRSMVVAEEANRRNASLRWGITMVALAAAFGLIQANGWTELNAGALALLVGATGIGNLIYFAMSRRLG